MSEAMELKILNIYLGLCTFSFSFITEKTRKRQCRWLVILYGCDMNWKECKSLIYRDLKQIGGVIYGIDY